ncbi:MAG: cytochrome b/b6 domain-containing protein [Sulfuriflexus sp.]|nr:cytochrome b/b6 domain-containing protein [Sulfuriflexus sp.]
MNKIYVWDPVVRLFHWSLVVAFVVAYISGDEESVIHTNAGYVILALIGIRVIWGLIGTRHARFMDFMTSPRKAIQYLWNLITGQKVKAYRGHNPAGGWMIIGLIVSLLFTVYSGLKMEATEGRGLLATTVSTPAYEQGFFISTARADDDEHDGDDRDEHDGDEFWEEIHEFFANFTVFLVILHIAGVLLGSYRHKVNLIRSMFTGYK